MTDPGDIPGGGRIDLVRALSIARDLPVEAIDIATERPDQIALAVLDVVERAATGKGLPETEQNLLFWGIHVLGQARDTRLFGPLLRLLARPEEELDVLLSDTLSETVPRILIAVYDGDLEAVRAAIWNPEVPGFSRWQLFLVLAWLAAAERVPPQELQDILVAFDDERPVDSSDDGWQGWEDAIAWSGLRTLVPRILAARDDARLLEGIARDDQDLERDLAEADGGGAAALARMAKAGLWSIGDAVDELTAYLSLTEAGEAPEPPVPTTNPMRKVGRNDPCPCGSGRKYKKCCLAEEA